MQDLFEYDPAFGIKTIDEFERLCQEYKKETESEELNDKLIDVFKLLKIVLVKAIIVLLLTSPR